MEIMIKLANTQYNIKIVYYVVIVVKQAIKYNKQRINNYVLDKYNQMMLINHQMDQILV